MKLGWLVIFFYFLVGGLLGQVPAKLADKPAEKSKTESPAKTSADKPPAATPTGTSAGVPFFSVDDATRLKIRDIEYQADQHEIAIGQMSAQIEKEKAAEAEQWKLLQGVASEYAQKNGIDPTKFDFDAKDVKFVKKK